MNKHFSIKSIFSILLLVFSTAWSFARVFMGLDLIDTFYFAVTYLYSGKVDVLFPLNQGLFVLTSRIFGDHIIAYRLVNWCFSILPPLMMCLFAVKRLKMDSGLSMILTSAAIILMTSMNIHVFNANSLSAICIIGSFIALYLLSENSSSPKNNLLWYVILFFCLTCGALSRFPNIVLLPLIAVLYGLVASSWRDYLKMIGCMIAVVITYVGVNSLIFKGVGNYVDNFLQLFMMSTNSVGANHSFDFLVSEYLHSFKDTVSDIKYLALIFIIPLFALNSRKWLRWVLFGLFVGLQILFVSLRVEVISDFFNYFLILYFYALICIADFLVIVVGLYRHDRKMIGWGIIPILFSLCSPAGSNSRLCLWGWSLFPLLPFVVNQLKKCVYTENKNEMLLIVASLVALSIVAVVYCQQKQLLTVAVLLLFFAAIWSLKFFNVHILLLDKWSSSQNGLNLKPELYALTLFATVLTFYAKSHTSFEFVEPSNFKCYHDEPKLQHVRTTCLNVQFVNDVMDDYKSLKTENQEIIFYGFNANVFNYLTEQHAVYGADFSQDDTEHNISALEAELASKPIVFLCPMSYTKMNYHLYEYENTIAMLIQHGYRQEIRGFAPTVDGAYAIFYPNN